LVQKESVKVGDSVFKASSFNGTIINSGVAWIDVVVPNVGIPEMDTLRGTSERVAACKAIVALADFRRMEHHNGNKKERRLFERQHKDLHDNDCLNEREGKENISVKAKARTSK
jgi:hypothetical protein